MQVANTSNLYSFSIYYTVLYWLLYGIISAKYLLKWWIFAVRWRVQHSVFNINVIFFIYMNLYDLANDKLWLNEYTEKQKKRQQLKLS